MSEPRVLAGKREALIGAVVCAAVALAACLFVAHNLDFAVDDSYITYQYARNLAEGRGLVFNVGERFYGSTATGYAVLLAMLSLFTRAAIPHVSTVLSAVGLTLCWASVAVGLSRSLGVTGVLASLAFAMFLFGVPPASAIAGHETWFFTGLMALALTLLFDFARPGAAFSLLAVASVSRPDAGLMALLAAGLSGLEVRRGAIAFRDWFRACAGYGAAMVGWLTFTRLYLGSWLPQTLQAKQAQYGWGLWQRYTLSNVGVEFGLFFGDGLTFLMTIAVIAGAMAVLLTVLRGGGRRASANVALAWAAFAVTSMGVYQSLRVSLWPWYVAPLFLAASVIVWRMGAEALGWLRARPPTAPVRMATLAARICSGGFAMGFAALGAPLVTTMPTHRNQNLHLTAYQPAIEYLRANEPGGTVVAMPEVGSFAYQLGPRFRVVDTLGLISPGVAPALKRGERNWVLAHARPRYLIISWPGPFNPDTDRFGLVERFTGPFWSGRQVMLYRALRDSDPG